MSKIERLSDELHQKVLGWTPQPIPASSLLRAKHGWESQGLAGVTDETEVVNLPYPEGLGTYSEVLEEAVELLGASWLTKLDDFAALEAPELPPMKPVFATGWQRYPTGNPKATWEYCEAPEGETMVLDFETGWTDPESGVWYPAVCCCLSRGYWYVWVADFQQPETAIAFGSGNLVVAHNAGYDRSFLLSEYAKEDSGNRFFDTMAAWIATRGCTNQQRSLVIMDSNDALDGWTKNAMPWLEETGKASLDAVYEFYYGSSLDKGVRDGIIKGGLRFIRDNLQEVIGYCLADVLATFRIFKRLHPEWCALQPSAVSRAAQLLLGNTWLPLSPSRFPGYYNRAEAKMQETLKEASKAIEARVEAILKVAVTPLETLVDRLKVEKIPVKDKPRVLQEWLEELWVANLPPQLRCLDWTPAVTGKAKGLPKWYRDWQAKGSKRLTEGKPTAISLGWREVPLILGMTWRDEPILWDIAKGFHTEAHGPLPHPEERGKAVTHLFTKGFDKLSEAGTLGCADGSVKELLAAAMSVVNWISLRKRVKAIHTEAPEGYPVTLPQLVVTGTVTRRCADNVWQVASNPKRKRIGTELKSMVEAPPGYKIVGADVDG